MTIPDWAAKLGFADEEETTNDYTIRTSTYVRAMVSSAGLTEGQPVIQIWATTNGRGFDSITLDRETAKSLIAQIAAVL